MLTVDLPAGFLKRLCRIDAAALGDDRRAFRDRLGVVFGIGGRREVEKFRVAFPRECNLQLRMLLGCVACCVCRLRVQQRPKPSHGRPSPVSSPASRAFFKRPRYRGLVYAQLGRDIRPAHAEFFQLDNAILGRAFRLAPRPDLHAAIALAKRRLDLAHVLPVKPSGLVKLDEELRAVLGLSSRLDAEG